MTAPAARVFLGTTLMLSALSGLGTAVGIAAQIAIVRELGVGVASDTYFTGLSAPLLAVGVISGAVSYRLVPALVKIKVAGPGYETAYRALLSSGVRVAGAVLLFGFVLSWLLALVQGSGQVPVGREVLTVAALGWLCAAFVTLTALMNAILHSEGRFGLPAAVSHMPQLFTLVWCLVAEAAAWQVAGALVLGQLVALLAIWRRCVPFLKAGPTVTSLDLGGYSGWIWVIVSMLVFVSFGTIDSIVAAGLGAGAVSSLGYGQRMAVNLAGVVVNSIGVIVLPVFAKLAVQEDWAGLSVQLARAMRIVVVVLCCPAAVIVALRMELISLLLFGANLPAEEMERLSAAICSLIWGVVPMACATILFRALYAQTLTRTAGWISLMGVGIYFAGSLLVVQLGAGLTGIGVAYCMVWTVVVAWGAKYVGEGYAWGTVAKSGGRLFLQVGVALTGVFSVLWFVKRHSPEFSATPAGDLITLALGSTAAAAIYAISLLLLGNAEMKEFITILKSRLVLRRK